MSEQSTSPRVDDAGGATPGGANSDDGAQESVPAADPDDGTSDAQVVGLESADAEDVLGAVGSDTARSILSALHGEPATASGVADRVDCSLQTVQYHLGNLADAGLVEVSGTTTSEKGREMDVYGPARGPVVVYAGDADDADDLRSVLSRLVSGVAFLGLLSLLVQELLGGGRGPVTTMSQDAAVRYTAESAGSGGAFAGVEPGLVFFAGGLVVLAAYFVAWSLRRRGVLAGLRSTA